MRVCKIWRLGLLQKSGHVVEEYLVMGVQMEVMEKDVWDKFEDCKREMFTGCSMLLLSC